MQAFPQISGRCYPAIFVVASATAKGYRQTGTLYERWNTYSRVRLTSLGESVPFGWVLARTQETKIKRDYLDIDGRGCEHGHHPERR